MSSSSARLYSVYAKHLPDQPLIGRLVVPCNTNTRSGTSQKMPSFSGAPGESLRFQYDEAWLKSGFALGSDVPLTRAIHRPKLGKSSFSFIEDRAISSVNLPVFFDSTQPDARILADAGKLENAALRLPHVEDSLGSLGFECENSPKIEAKPRVRRTLELPELIYASHALERGKAGRAELALLQRALTFPGERPVFSVERDRVPQTLRLRTMNDPIDRPLWGHLALVVAERCGLNTVQSTLEREMGESVWFTTRADRDASGRPLMMLTAATLATVTSSARPLKPGYLAIADILNREGACPTEDLPEAWRRLTFNLMTGGSGDSLKRWQFVRESLGWRLAPAYTFEWNPNETRPGLTIDGRKRLSIPEDALQYAPYFGLTVTEAKQHLMQIRRVFSDWEGLAVELGADPRDMAYMASFFDEHL